MASLVIIIMSHRVLRLVASHLSPLLSLLCLSHCVTASLTSLPSLVSGLADYQLMAQNSADRV